LEDEVLDLFDESVYIVGRRDEEEPGLRLSQGEKRKTAGELARNLDKSKILIDLEHEPKEVPEVAAAGFDLQLAGHTHNGQFFPLNLGIGRIYFNAFGYKVYENKLHTVTTAGVGSYGPFNRACVDPEIMILDITFQ
ncbi:MAG: metallophosphoesterase, partial [Lachnospiraceae bacterium]